MTMQAQRLSAILDVVVKLGVVGQEDCPQTACFEVDGHSLVAIAYTRPDQELCNDYAGAGDLAIIGQLECDGKHYLIFRANEYSEDDADISASTVADVLTRRELQIATLIGEGKSDKEIARRLGISGYTVREHIRRIFAKLNIGRRAAIVSYVLRQRNLLS